jgi:hypothetical protein
MQNAYARNKGSDPPGQDPDAITDLDGVTRPGNISDLGCYTWTE